VGIRGERASEAGRDLYKNEAGLRPGGPCAIVLSRHIVRGTAKGW
jgi:hypothetical protein